MALVIDTARAFRTLDELEALVRAVMAADEHDEGNWVEWKGDLDLGAKEGQFAISKAILGLSNRSVADAARHCEGCGYVVVGADHDGLHGLTTVDFTVLEQGLAVYLGTGVGTPRWSPRYLDVDGQKVLVITVEPPRLGDRIHTLRKAFNNSPAGLVLVRGQAKSEAASPGEIAALEQRLLDGVGDPEMDLRVDAKVGGPLLPVQPPTGEQIRAWVRARTDEIWAAAPAVARHPPAPKGPLGLAFPDYIGAIGSPDRARFKEMVDEYARDCAQVLPRALVRGVVESRRGKVAPRVVNTTTSMLADLTVVAEIDAALADVYGKPPEDSRLPEKPKWSDASPIARIGGFDRRLADLVPRVAAPGSASVERDGSVIRVTWALGDVHVEQQMDGAAVTVIPLLGVDEVGVRWRATASSRRGAARGGWTLLVDREQPVAPS